MSVFSGKCDVYDHIWIGNKTVDEVNAKIARTDFYIRSENGRKHKLDIHNLKDIAPYFPYLVGCGAFNKEGRNMVILSSESFVDQEEREFMEYDLRDALKEYRRCKRKKIPFDPDAYYEKYYTWSKRNYTREIVDRVARDGEKATLDGLYSDFKDKWDRTMLARELSKFGYNDYFINSWVFGYRKEYPNWKEESEEK